MATLKERIDSAVKAALRSGDAQRKITLRAVLAGVQQAEVDQRIELDEVGVAAVLQKEIKAQREALADAERASRPDLIAATTARIAILEEFLPPQLTRDEIAALARSIIVEVGASSPHQMGDVMTRLLPQTRGRADGKLVSAIVAELLQNGPE